ncbi:MAG: CRISPR-associated primase-polymerase type B [Bacteroides pyogenes]|jgi:hypothetical protein|uniref:CRISPR-associated primase-polymerase type B n=1 Tax=Bacteroides pyogenes TaxID=310300 RepID=UPI0024333461|nr:CRISPR-associated primase-polymerase type B [Bacteroides pyogenes]MCI7069910.1 CRISPR-associated primase-polymerase type B [Bacteroides pyogenes]
MIQVGKNITSLGEQLQKVSIDYLFHAIRKPQIEIENKIKQLRIVRNIDHTQYNLLKKQLPYFVCGLFNPNIRRIDNFAYISYFVIDIDHITEKGLNLQAVREKLEADSRVYLSFLSPSEDGLKIMFRLSERCYDAGIYSLFYKLFLIDFSRQYQLEQVVDSRTSDVTRACFISLDPDVYYNPQADTVNLHSFVNINNPCELFDQKKNIEKIEKEQQSELNVSNTPKEDVDNEIIQQIKTILKNNPYKSEKQPIYVPEQLNEIISDLATYISQTGFIIKEIRNISYGKKIKASIGIKEAEANLFYGKRGFSVVQSPRTGTSPQLNEMLAELIETFLQTLL